MIATPRPPDPVVFEQLLPKARHLRIALVTETYPPEVNGVANMLFSLVNGLHERDHEVQLVRPRQAPGDLPAQMPGLKEVLTGGLPIPNYPGLRMGLPAKAALVKHWMLHRPDVVHIATEGPLGWSALAVAIKLKLPVVSEFRTNFHDYSPYYGIGWMRRPIVAYLRKFHNRTRMTIVPTESLARELENNGFRNLRVLPRGVDTARFHPARRSEALRRAWGVAADAPVLLHVGRLAAEKNLGMLATLLRAVKASHPGARLVLVGDGPYGRELKVQLPEAIFVGVRTGEDLAAHFASGDIFVFPSLTETYGNVTLEALASGLPVVAFDYAAARDHVVAGKCGLLAAYGRNEELVGRAVELAGIHATDPDRLAAMRAHARRVAEAVDWNSTVTGMEQLLLEVV